MATLNTFIVTLLLIITYVGITNAVDSLGCYEEVKRNRMFNLSPGEYDPESMTPAVCATLCGPYHMQYAATSGRFCFCATSLPDNSRKKPDANCNKPCPGNVKVKCGGHGHISVFNSSQPIISVKLWTSRVVSVVKTEEQIRFHYSGSADVVLKYQFNYGDGLGFTKSNVSGMDTHAYDIPGIYRAAVKASDPDDWVVPKVAVRQVRVVDGVADVSVTCQQGFATFEEGECVITIYRGTELKVIDTVDNREQERYVTDPLLYYAGGSIPIEDVQARPQQDHVDGTVFVFAAAEFTHTGKVLAWEMYVQKKGKIKLAILKPHCNNYCYTMNACDNRCGYTCKDSSFGASRFCVYKKTCSAQCARRERHHSMGRYSYDVREVVNVEATSTGFQRLEVNQLIQVFAGDVLAWQYQPSGGIVSQIEEPDTSVDFIYPDIKDGLKPGTVINMDTDANIEGKRHLIRAVVDSPSVVKVKYTFTDTGKKNVSVNVSSAVGGNFKLVYQEILVVEGINETRVVNKKYAATGEDAEFSILPHTGTSIKYDWEFGDGSVRNETSKSTIKYKYKNKGNYTIRATSWNIRSMKTNTTQISVQDGLKDLTISVKTHPVIAGNVTIININLGSGSNYFCMWTFGDGFKNRTSELDSPLGSSEMRYTYKERSRYVLTVSCRNKVSMVNDSVMVDVIEYISGLRLERTGAGKNEDFKIGWFLTSGTNVTFNLIFNGARMFVEKSDLKNRHWETAIQKSLPLGVYDLKLSASNELNYVELETKFTVLVAIKDINITTTELTVPLLGSVTFHVDMLEGSNVEVVWDYDDGHKDTFSLGANDWIGHGPETKSHVFGLAKRHNVTITIENYAKRVVKNVVVIAIQSVDNVTMEAPAFAVFAPPGNVNFTFTTPDPQHPNEATVNFQFGDSTDLRNQSFDLLMDQPYRYGYRNRQVYNMTALIENYFSNKSFSHRVKIVEPIERMRVETIPPSAIIGEPLQVKVIMYRGPSAPDCNLEFDFGDGSPLKVIPRKGHGQDGEDTVTVTYKDLTRRVINVTARTPVENVTATYKVDVERKVFDMIEFKSNHPVKHGDPLEFYITYPNKPLPTNAFIEFDYGDGSPPRRLPFEFPEGPGGTRTYKYSPTEPGHRQVKIRIFNNASSVEKMMEAGSYEPFEGLHVIPTFIPALPVNATARHGLEGNNYKFPRNLDVRFNMTMTKGTALFFDMKAKGPGSVVTCHQTTNPFSCSFNVLDATSGIYTVEITAGNALYNSTVEKKIKFLDSVYKLKLVDLTPKTVADDPKKLEITFNMTGTDSCLYIDFGDGRSKSKYSASASFCTVPGFEGSQYRGPLKQRTELKYTYVDTGFYEIKVLAHNAISNESTSVSFSISDMDCNKPRIRIHKRSLYFYQPTMFRRGSTIKLSARTNISCAVTFDNTKQWEMQIIEPNWGIALGNVDLKKLGIQTNHAEMLIRPRTLAYGIYKAMYKVEMATKNDEGVRYPSSSFTFIQIVPSDLVGMIEKGGVSEITRSYGQMVVLNPGKYSHDPDIGRSENQRFTSFIWSCKDLLEPSERCPNILPTFSSKMITFSTTVMKEIGKYELTVTMYKDKRRTNAKLILHIIPAPPSGAIPSVIIECAGSTKCVQLSVGKLVSSTARLGLKCVCTDCNSTTKLQYQWTGASYDYTWPWKPFIEEDLKKHTLGMTGKQLSVNSRLYAVEEEVRRYQFGCTIKRPGANIGGQAFIEVTLNKPPVPGTCRVSPRNGTVSWGSESKFCIYCSGWSDDNQIVEYKFFTKKKRNDLEYHLTTAEEASRVCVDLPMGATYDDYRLELWVKVRDSLDAVYSFKIDTVQVYPISTQVIRENTLKDLEATNTNLDLLLAEGDQKTITEKLTELGSMLNFDHRQSQLEYAGLPTAGNMEFSLFGIDGESMFDGFDEGISGNKSDLIMKANIERDNRAKLREKAVKGCAGVTTNDVAAIEQVSTCLATNSLSASECSKECQLAVANKSIDMAYLLKDMELSIEDLKAASMGILSAISSASDAAAFNLKTALKSEYDKDQLSVEFFNFDTNLESKEKDYKTSDKNRAEFLHTMDVHERLQMETAKQIAETQQKAREIIEEVWAQTSLPGETAMLQAPSFTMSLSNMAVEDIPGMTFQAGGEPTNDFDIQSFTPAVTFTGQSATNMFGENQVESGDHFAIAVSATKNDAGRYVSSSNQLGDTSNFVSVSVTDTLTGFPLEIKDSPDDFIIIIPREENKEGLLFKEIKPVLASNSALFYHKAKVSNKQASFHMEFNIDNPEAQLLVIINFEKKPDIEKNQCDFIRLIPKSMKNRTKNDPKQMTVFLNNHMVDDFVGDVYVGVRQLEKEDHDKVYVNCASLPKFNKSTSVSAFQTNYSSRIYTSGCYFFDHQTQQWETDGLTVGPNTDAQKTECLSNHLTTFAGGWFVSPNTIDWDFVFSHADFYSNPTVYITEIIVVALYILAVILARRKDKKDIEKLGLTPLKDNHAKDKYYYEVIVFTGMRRNAGTDSKVFVIFSGEKDETDARMLADDKRKIFRRGGVDGFLMAVPQPLGSLNYARIWHDNSGKGKFGSWFLKYIIVRDIQTDEKFVLIANRWFAVEEDDGQVDRVVPVAGKEQMTEFSHLFTERSQKSLVDGHIWFSVVARPPQSRFTCVQRVSCCLCLLFATMLANAMFYGIPKNDDQKQTFVLGPFALTPTQIFIGVISNLIVFPINFVIITLFRKSRARTKRPSRIEEALKAVPSASVDDVKPELGPIWHIRRPFGHSKDADAGSRPESARSEKSVQSVAGYTEKRAVGSKKQVKKKKFELPWWCRIVAWVLLWCVTFTATAFVTFYAIQFGDTKTKKWITSLLISFLTSVFLTQPAKVFLTAMFLALVFKSPGEDESEQPEDEEEPTLLDKQTLATDEEYLHHDSNYGPTRPRKIGYKPPERAELERAREERIKEIKMWDIIREIILYSFFLWILMVISYRQRSPDGFLYKDSLEKLFINNRDMKMSFMKIRNTEDLWTWCQNDLVKSLRASNYYNNYPPLMLRGYLGDKVSRIMGYATLRQLRVKPGTCEPCSLIKHITPTCNKPYTIFIEDKKSYDVSWFPLENRTNIHRPEYTYTKASKLNGYPFLGEMGLYGGGGYVLELRQSMWVMENMMRQLQREQWIDKHTRAVFVELAVYNPQVNLFAIVTIVAEILATGGVVPSYRIEPAMLLPYMSSALLFQILCEIVYFVFTIVFIFKELKKMQQMKFNYFKSFWNLIEIFIIAMSVSAIIVYFYKFVVTNKLTSQFKVNKGNKYMKFQYVGYWNEVFTYVIGWLVFFGSLKFLKLLRFNKRMSLLAATLKKGAKRLVHFSLIFWIVFLAFIQLFYLTFLSTSLSFSNFIGSFEAGILMIMGKLDIFSMSMVSPIMSHIYVFMFVFTLTFILVNMFLSILNETFAQVRAGLTKECNDYELLSFMMDRFKTWTGLWDRPEDEEVRVKQQKSKAYCSKTALAIEEFPDRIDRLLNSISNVYIPDDDPDIDPSIPSRKMTMKKLMKQDDEPLLLDDISEGKK